jgi:glycosyltransferase involved in cell wall biosynthesis
MGLREPRVITTNPLLAGLAPFDWAHSVTFFATDDWRAYGKHRQWWPAYEKSFRRFALSGRRLCAVSAPIVERIAPVGPAIVVPNGIEPTEWLPLPPAPKWMAELPAPRLLYLGSLDSRLDLRALEALAEHMPHATLLLVGPAIDTGALNSLQERQKNIVVRPSVDRREVAGITRAANVCLIPHESNLLTQAMSPLKLYEYLAAGRPVVATDLPPLREISDRISLVRPGEDWAPHVENALAQEPPTELERVGFVRENSWVARQDRLLELALAE